jgi:hypothetical protein
MNNWRFSSSRWYFSGGRRKPHNPLWYIGTPTGLKRTLRFLVRGFIPKYS